MSATGRSANIRRWLAALSWPEALRDPELAFVRAVAASLANQLDEPRTGSTWRAPATSAPSTPAGSRSGSGSTSWTAPWGVNDVGRALEAARRASLGHRTRAGTASRWRASGRRSTWPGRREATSTLRVAVGRSVTPTRSCSRSPSGTSGWPSRPPAPSPTPTRCSTAWPTSCARRRRPSVPRRRALLAQGERRAPGGRPPGAPSWVRSRDRHPGGRCPAARGSPTRPSCSPRPSASWGTRPVRSGPSSEHRRSSTGSPTRRAGRPSRGPACGVAAPARHATEFGEELSAREVVVLRLAADGLQQREIADQLFISYNTVKSHLKAAYRKLGVASREAAIERLHQLDAAHRARLTTRVRCRAGGPPGRRVRTMSG